MSGWQVGDLAVCIKKGGWAHSASRRPAEGPAFGEVLMVRRTGVSGNGFVILWLEGWPGETVPSSFIADRFRKAVTDKHEACESEFVTLLTRIKRKQGADA